MEQKPNRIIIHHSADSETLPQFWKINDYHRSIGFPQSFLGYFGGYHYLIERTGLVFQYRREDENGSHDAGENLNSLGVCLAGNFDKELPTPAQETALAELLEKLLARWSIPINRIDPHRFGDTTNCPGIRLADTWAREIYLIKKISWLKRILLWLTQPN